MSKARVSRWRVRRAAAPKTGRAAPALDFVVSAGSPEPLGVTLDATGANVAVFSATAEAIDLCLYDEDGERELARLRLPERSGPVWHGHIAGVGPGARYGLRAHGRFAPHEGLFFNPTKLLLDPYAYAVDRPIVWHEAMQAEDPHHLGRPDEADSGPYTPKCVAMEPPPKIDPRRRPKVPWSETVLYEAHAKGLTKLWPGMNPEVAGTVEALGQPEVIRHIKQLGVTSVELLPLHLSADERRLAELGLTNYWGYNTIGFLAPEPALLGPNGLEGLRETVRRLHAAGLEAILDVVYNHTGEGGRGGAQLSFRGLDDRAYYRRSPPGGDDYANDSGCGNTVDLSHPMALRLALDSLRYWAERIGFDGFRFDLAPALTRGHDGGVGGSSFLDALLQDPVLRELKLIAEPWDIGYAGYQLGGFPAPFAEWNDRFRDHVRGFWRGEHGSAGGLADGFLGSASLFDRAGRRPWASVNFVACHDGFTLADLTMYFERRNHANLEDNRDGHGHNLSDNLGVEGPSDDPGVEERRALRRRNLLATVLLAQGAPMIRAGDEVAQTQNGNNNAYCQDNEISWIDWSVGDTALARFVGRVLAVRKRFPTVRQQAFLHARIRSTDQKPDVEWSSLAGGPVPWNDPEMPGFRVLLRGAAEALEAGRDDPDPVLLALNPSRHEVATPLPEIPGRRWRKVLDTTHPDAPARVVQSVTKLSAESLVVFAATPEKR